MPKISATYLDLQLTYRFTISRSSKTSQASMIISYEDQGIVGYGECTAHHYYGYSIESGRQALGQHAHLVESWPQTHPEEFYHHLQSILPDMPFLRCAIDQAYWDWYGKKLKQTTRELLNISNTCSAVTSYTIGIDTLDKMKAKMEENPWSSYKIKLSADQDLEFIQALYDFAQVPICIDANASWSEDDLIYRSCQLKSDQVRFIEQPMDRSEWQAMERVKAVSSIPLIADESCLDWHDIEKCETAFDGVNIKLMKCGGITPAYKMIKEARRRNLQVMIGCMTESSIGISAAAQLAPLVDFIDLDGSMLITNDPAIGVKWTPDSIVWPDTYGNGTELIQDNSSS